MNITEFANIAGVSKSAVSRYFNNGYLSEDKRKIIEEAVKNTGYSPNVQAQTIRTRVTKMVGVILPKLSSESCARVVEGISQVLEKEGYQILLVNTDNNADKEVEYLDLFKNNRVDGVILLASILTDNHKHVLKQMNIPVIIIGQEYKGYTSVYHDDYGAAYTLTKHMIEVGATKPAYIGVTEKDVSVGQQRKKGFMDALAEENIGIEPHKMVQSKFDIDAGYDAMKRLMYDIEDVDSLFCATDNIAIGAMKCLRENGIKIPEDIILTSIGDSKLANTAAVPITSVKLYYKSSGIMAAEEFIASLNKRARVAKSLKLDYKLNVRESTKK